jgi:hypothetical protein
VSITAYVITVLYTTLYWVLDSWRRPDIVLRTDRSPDQVRHDLTGRRSWDRPLTFDARGRGNGFCVGPFFEIWPEVRTYLHRLPDFISTEHYPVSFGIVGTVTSSTARSSTLQGWYRLTNPRAVFYGIVTAILFSVVADFLVVPCLPFPQPLRPSALATMLLACLLTPFTMILAVAISRLFTPKEQIEELAGYLRHLFPDEGRAA